MKAIARHNYHHHSCNKCYELEHVAIATVYFVLCIVWGIWFRYASIYICIYFMYIQGMDLSLLLVYVTYNIEYTSHHQQPQNLFSRVWMGVFFACVAIVLFLSDGVVIWSALQICILIVRSTSSLANKWNDEGRGSRR